jgi:uncharacterized membrane protein YbhN (UPF0104 family)
MGDETRAAQRKKVRRVVQGLASLAVVVAIFVFALPQFADFSKVWASIAAMTPIELFTLALAAVWNIVTYWFVMVAALPGSNYWQAMKVNQTSTAVSNTLPGGSALGIGVTYAMYAAYGFSHSEIGLSILVTGLWNNFVKLGMPIVALALLALEGGASGGRLSAALLGVGVLVAAVVLFAMALSSEKLARKVGDGFGSAASFFTRLIRRRPVSSWGDAVVRFRRNAISLLRRRWLWLTLATVVGHLSLFFVLLLSLRHIGVSAREVSFAEALAAFSFVRLVTALPITPGGLGVVELALSGALIAAGGPRAPVVAAVLIYRGLTYVLPIPFGLIAYLKWKRGSEARRVRADEMRARRAAEEAMR